MKQLLVICKEIECDPTTGRRACKRLGIGKTGRDYVLDEKQEIELKSNIQKKAGRPKKLIDGSSSSPNPGKKS